MAGPAAVLASAAGFALTWLRIRRHGRSGSYANADIIVVFAAATYPDGPSPELAARLRHTRKLYSQGRSPTILCSGGHPGPNSEPRIMQRALIDAGVPEDAILIEETGSSTRRTLAAVERLGNGRWKRILVVSSPYHMYRIVTEARRLGLAVIGSAPPTTPITKRLRPRLRQTVREVAAVWWYAMAPSRRRAVRFPQPAERAPTNSPGAEAKQIACAVLSLANEPGLVDAVRSALAQNPVPEVVVVNSGGGDPASTLRAAGTNVRLIDVDDRRCAGAVRNLGIAATSAPIVGFLAADCIAGPEWAAARLRAHEQGAGVVAGTVTVAPPRTLSAYASHLLLHHRARPEAPSQDRVLATLSYARSVLGRCGPFREDLRIGEDTDYFERLEPEEIIAWAPDASTAVRYPQTPSALIRDQFRRGRKAARHAMDLGDRDPRRRIASRNLRNIGSALNRARTVADVDERRSMLAAAPLLVIGALACASGVVTTPRRPSQLPEPPVTRLQSQSAGRIADERFHQLDVVGTHD